MAHYLTIPDAARHFHKHPRSIDNWLKSAFIRGYDDGSGRILVDADEIEAAFKINPKMRDARKRYGRATIVPIAPVVAAAKAADQ